MYLGYADTKPGCLVISYSGMYRVYTRVLYNVPLLNTPLQFLHKGTTDAKTARHIVSTVYLRAKRVVNVLVYTVYLLNLLVYTATYNRG